IHCGDTIPHDTRKELFGNVKHFCFAQTVSGDQLASSIYMRPSQAFSNCKAEIPMRMSSSTSGTPIWQKYPSSEPASMKLTIGEPSCAVYGNYSTLPLCSEEERASPTSVAQFGPGGMPDGYSWPTVIDHRKVGLLWSTSWRKSASAALRKRRQRKGP